MVVTICATIYQRLFVALEAAVVVPLSHKYHSGPFYVCIEIGTVAIIRHFGTQKVMEYVLRDI